MPAPKVPTMQFHATCSTPLYSILDRTLPHVDESEGKRLLPIKPFGKMLLVMKLASLSLRDTNPTVQYIPSSLPTQPSEQALPELGILQCNIKGAWVKQVLPNLFSVNFSHALVLLPSPLL